MGVITKVVAGSVSAVAASVVWGRFAHHNHEAAIKEDHMVVHDHMHHLKENFYGYSGYPMLQRFKEWLFDPSQTHWLTRPLVRLKGVFDATVESLLPLSLMALGLGFAFSGRWGGMGRTLMRGVRALGAPTATLLSWTGRALGDAGRNAVAWLAGRRWTYPGWKPVASVGMMGALSVYLGHLFYREVTEQNRENTFNFLAPPGH